MYLIIFQQYKQINIDTTLQKLLLVLKKKGNQMKIHDIYGHTGNSKLLIGEQLDKLADYVPSDNLVIITDEQVKSLYIHKLPHAPIICIGIGEKIKNLETIKKVYQKLISLEADRSTFIVGIGGGIVCDITGFAASTYLRGLNFGLVASTLLAQVDASVGGKNGVNFNGYKNMVGVFNQPEFVICDLNLLSTLSTSDISCGLAEIVKHAAIADPDLFSFMEKNVEKILNLDFSVLERLVSDSILIKAAIVNRDEKELGERRKLNFGHTMGHAIEKVTGIPHGEAVSQGMTLAAALSKLQGLLSNKAEKRLLNLLKRLKLPIQTAIDPELLLDALNKDKKREGEKLHFVLLSAIGSAEVVPIPLDKIKEAIYNLS